MDPNDTKLPTSSGMQPASQNQPTTDQSVTQPIAQGQPVAGTFAKEHDFPPVTPHLNEQGEVQPEYQVPKEVGPHVVQVSEKVTIPEDLKKVGVASPPIQEQVTQPTKPVGPNMPLTDDQIGQNSTGDVKNSLSWLANWCLCQLGKVHVHLKKIGAHFVRIMDMKKS